MSAAVQHIITMPKLGLTMTEGTVAEWLVQPGSRLRKGDIFAIIETDKIANELEAPGDGVLTETYVDAGQVAEVGQSLAAWRDDLGSQPVAGDGNEPNPPQGAELDVQPRAAPAGSPVVGQLPQELRPAAEISAGPKIAGGRIVATPYARRIAAEAGIRLEGIAGSGPSGRIRACDVERVVEADKAEVTRPEREETMQLAPLVPSSAAPQSLADTAVFVLDIDLGPVLEVLGEIERARPGLASGIDGMVVLAILREAGTQPEFAGWRVGVTDLPPTASVGGGAVALDTDAGFGTVLEGLKSCRSGQGSAEASFDALVFALDEPAPAVFVPPLAHGCRLAFGIGHIRKALVMDSGGQPVEKTLASLAAKTTTDNLAATRILLDSAVRQLARPLSLLV